MPSRQRPTKSDRIIERQGCILSVVTVCFGTYTMIWKRNCTHTFPLGHFFHLEWWSTYTYIPLEFPSGHFSKISEPTWPCCPIASSEFLAVAVEFFSIFFLAGHPVKYIHLQKSLFYSWLDWLISQEICSSFQYTVSPNCLMPQGSKW